VEGEQSEEGAQRRRSRVEGWRDEEVIWGVQDLATPYGKVHRVDYDGTPVEYWKDLGIEFDIASIEQPVVDLTPSPAVSSFVVYHGAAFPEWDGDLEQETESQIVRLAPARPPAAASVRRDAPGA